MNVEAVGAAVDLRGTDFQEMEGFRFEVSGVDIFLDSQHAFVRLGVYVADGQSLCGLWLTFDGAHVILLRVGRGASRDRSEFHVSDDEVLFTPLTLGAMCPVSALCASSYVRVGR